VASAHLTVSLVEQLIVHAYSQLPFALWFVDQAPWVDDGVGDAGGRQVPVKKVDG